MDDVAIVCTGPLALTESAPVDDYQNLSRNIELRLTFSADIDESTAAAETFTLESDAGEARVATVTLIATF